MGEIVSFKKIKPIKTNFIRNFGIWLKYDSKNGPINIYKEYRDISTTGAIEQMYLEMAGSYKVRWSSIVVLRIEEIHEKECIRAKIKQFHGLEKNFPVQSLNYRGYFKSKKNDFKAGRMKKILMI